MFLKALFLAYHSHYSNFFVTSGHYQLKTESHYNPQPTNPPCFTYAML